MPTKAIALFGYDGLGIRAGFTASSEQVDHPDDNLNDITLGRSWKSALGALSAVTLTWDNGVAVEVGGVGFAGVNWTSAAQWRIVLSNNASLTPAVAGGDSGQVPVWDTSRPVLAGGPSGPWMPPWGRFAAWFPAAPVSARYGRLTLWDAANADNHLRAAVPLFGPIWQPGIGIEPGWVQDTRWMGEPGNRLPLRGHRLALHRLLAAERSQLSSLANALTDQGRLAVVPRPLTPAAYLEEAYFAHLEGDGLEMAFAEVTSRFSRTELVFREADV